MQRHGRRQLVGISGSETTGLSHLQRGFIAASSHSSLRPLVNAPKASGSLEMTAQFASAERWMVVLDAFDEKAGSEGSDAEKRKTEKTSAETNADDSKEPQTPAPREPDANDSPQRPRLQPNPAGSTDLK